MKMGGEERRWFVVVVTVIWMVGIIPPVCIGKLSEGPKMSENSSYSHHSDQYWQCSGSVSGSVHDCQSPDMEWLMDSEISRRILPGTTSGGLSITQAAVKVRNKPAMSCGLGKDYKRCLPDPNPVDHGKENCESVYNRACP